MLTPLQACSAYVGEPVFLSYRSKMSIRANLLLMWLATGTEALGSCFTGLYPFFREFTFACALLSLQVAVCATCCMFCQCLICNADGTKSLV